LIRNYRGTQRAELIAVLNAFRADGRRHGTAIGK
jgi:hypothetical protein